MTINFPQKRYPSPSTHILHHQTLLYHYLMRPLKSYILQAETYHCIQSHVVVKSDPSPQVFEVVWCGKSNSTSQIRWQHLVTDLTICYVNLKRFLIDGVSILNILFVTILNDICSVTTWWSFQIKILQTPLTNFNTWPSPPNAKMWT